MPPHRKRERKSYMAQANNHRRRIRSKKSRRERVLDAAQSLFFEKGYRGTTVEQIAKRAGYSKRTVYLDFKNKDDLFMSVCALGMALLVDKMQEVPTDLEIEEFVDSFLGVLTGFARDQEKYLRMFTVEATREVVANCSEEVREYVTSLERTGYDIVVAQITKGIQEKVLPDVDPMEAAGVFLGSVTGIILLSTGGSQAIFSRETLESMVRNAGHLLLAGFVQTGKRRRLWRFGR